MNRDMTIGKFAVCLDQVKALLKEYDSSPAKFDHVGTDSFEQRSDNHANILIDKMYHVISSIHDITESTFVETGYMR